ncbi:DUF5320 domain-containing protein [Sedimentibacter sp.]|uniref:DUF5320 domain-containing protein n=1 Tax=Sedimentibacter sp. TaxID=1960295 RepID=UPI0028ABC571|nr:DUF5320 domain-containing protein [Sedimentibacter sp.]
MPGRDGTGPMNRGFGYGKRFCSGDLRRSGCFGYGMGYRYKLRKEFLQDYKDFLKERLEEIDAELENIN